MGPYFILNSVFIGLYGFSAIYHFVLWWQSRREPILLFFAVHCALCALLSADLMALAGATTVVEGQQALDRRVAVAATIHITQVWLLSLVSGLPARWYGWFITVTFLLVAVLSLAVVPIVGTVISVERVPTAWGVISVLRRDAPGSWVGLIYAASFSVNGFGYLCAARLWRRDWRGALLVALANSGGVAVGLWGFRVDTMGSNLPYLGAVHYPLWVVLIALQIARTFRRRADERNRALQDLEQSREQLQRLTAGLLMAREEERTAIAREIHDELGQTLTALKMDVSWVGARSPDGVPALKQKLTAMAGLIDDTIGTVRRIATSLRPGVLDDLGLVAAVEWQAQEFQQRTGIRCVLRTQIDDVAVDPLASTALFRILQESLTNVARHSRASLVNIDLEPSGDDLVLEVRDNGIGMLPAVATSTRSIGLTGMRERAQLAGGAVSISGTAGAGTAVRAQVPRRTAAGV